MFNHIFKKIFSKFNNATYSSDKVSLNRILGKALAANLAALFLLLSPMSFAELSMNAELASHSFGGIKNNLTAQEKKHEVTKAINSNRFKTLTYKGMKRADVALARKQEMNALSSKNAIKHTEQTNIVRNSALYYSFSIYNAYSQLIEDIDEDGYFQTFSVTFDADILSPIINDQAVVYADLYLSENGGPWVLYFSTDDFVITGDASDDEFEVITQLASGYRPNNYDVLIDLYEAGYSDVVATYSSNDSNELYALPLESSDFDPEYIEVEYYSEHGGGSAVLLAFIVVALCFRRVFAQ